ncbi:hypothetical protein NDU88_001863 [Pleurodeles waltl]|uniref:Uncharacterized protein n=1 Tax=Pleurodeles waltl TaxID=8319 RepID=A0AAV7S8T9_PLEWA|nr:hypothetical protein NDU88_001863 [Pleurodeles waltl]
MTPGCLRGKYSLLYSCSLSWVRLHMLCALQGALIHAGLPPHSQDHLPFQVLPEEDEVASISHLPDRCVRLSILFLIYKSEDQTKTCRIIHYSFR